MTDLKNFEPIQINTLYGFENVRDCYWLVGYDVINKETNRKMTISIHMNKYPFVTLAVKDKSIARCKKGLMHYLLALAHIKNDKFEAVEYIDGNTRNYDIANLRITTKSELASLSHKKSSYKKPSMILEVTLKNGESYRGSMKELARALNINRNTISRLYHKQTSGREIQSVNLVPNSDSRSTD